MVVKAIVFSLIGSFCMAYAIVSTKRDEANDFGDSTGSVSDFSGGSWEVITSKDYDSKKKEWINDMDYIDSIFEETKS